MIEFPNKPRYSFNTGAALVEPLAQEMVAPVGESYKYAPWSEAGADASYRFTHDRVQQAAYAMTPSSERPQIRERAGRFILESSSPEEREERLFEIVGHLNQGAILTPHGRDELAEMNLRAGQRARESNAYEAALAFFGFGVDLIVPASDPRLRHELVVRRIEAMYLCVRFEEAELLPEQLFEHTEASLDKVAVLEQLMLAHTTRLHYRRAIETSVRALALLGESVPARPKRMQVMAELVGVRFAMRGRRAEDLLTLPRMENAQNSRRCAS